MTGCFLIIKRNRLAEEEERLTVSGLVNGLVEFPRGTLLHTFRISRERLLPFIR